MLAFGLLVSASLTLGRCDNGTTGDDDNGSTASGKVATPTANPAVGIYTMAQSITLSCGTAGATIRYTINGSTPTAGSILYTGSISIPAGTTIKAIAVKAGMDNSDVLTAAYTITGEDVILPDSATPLSEGVWTEEALNAGEVLWYSFTASGGNHDIYWKDYETSGSTKTCTIKVSAYKSDGTAIFTSGYNVSSPKTISGHSGTIYLKVEGEYETESGTFAIKYQQ